MLNKYQSPNREPSRSVLPHSDVLEPSTSACCCVAAVSSPVPESAASPSPADSAPPPAAVVALASTTSSCLALLLLLLLRRLNPITFKSESRATNEDRCCDCCSTAAASLLLPIPLAMIILTPCGIPLGLQQEALQSIRLGACGAETAAIAFMLAQLCMLGCRSRSATLSNPEQCCANFAIPGDEYSVLRWTPICCSSSRRATDARTRGVFGEMLLPPGVLLGFRVLWDCVRV